MPLDPDDTVCFCFHVPLRKIESFCRIEKPKAPSQISECLSAGTGCGWCVPMLCKIHRQLCGEHTPWWRKIADEAPDSPDIPASADRPEPSDEIDAADYAAGRQKYLKDNHIQPPNIPLK